MTRRTPKPEKSCSNCSIRLAAQEMVEADSEAWRGRRAIKGRRTLRLDLAIGKLALALLAPAPAEKTGTEIECPECHCSGIDPHGKGYVCRDCAAYFERAGATGKGDGTT